MTSPTGYLINGQDIATWFGPKGASTAAATGFKVNGTDLNQLLMARADGVDIGFNTGLGVNGTDLRNYFGAPAGNTPLPINGKAYHVTGIFAAAGAGSVTFQFQLVSGGGTWVTNCARVGTTGGTPPQGTIDTGANPSGAAYVRFTPTYLASGGDTGPASSVNNSAPSMTAISNGLTLGINLGGSGGAPTQSTYNFKVEYMNSGGTVISTSNFTCQLLCEGSA